MTVLSGTKKILSSVSSDIKSLIKAVTGFKVVSKISKPATFSLNSLGKFVGKVPIGGKAVGYVFKQSGKGVVIVATTSDNLIDKTGNIAIEILNKSKDLTFLTLNTASGSVKRLVGSTRRRKRRKGRRKKTRRNNRKRTRRRSQRGGE